MHISVLQRGDSSRLSCTFVTALWNVCLAVYEVAHAVLSSLTNVLHCTWRSPRPDAEYLYQLAQSKRVCVEQVYLIPKANWIHLKIQGQPVINCYPKKGTLRSCRHRGYLHGERRRTGQIKIQDVSKRRSLEEGVQFWSLGRQLDHSLTSLFLGAIGSWATAGTSI